MATFRVEDGKLVVVLTQKERQRALVAQRMGNVVVSDLTQPRTYATKAERAAGNGNKCPNCARNDLRFPPVIGRSFHEKDFKGNTEICDFR